MLRLHRSTLFHPKELDRKTRMFVSLLVNDFGYSLISLFVPIFLWIEGFTLTHISLFLVMSFLFRILFNKIAYKIFRLVGPSTSLKLGYVSSLIAVASLVALTSSDNLSMVLLIVAAMASGMNNGLYWLARHINVEMITTESNAGATAGWIRVFESIVLTLGPLVGGIIAANYGTEAALILSFVIMLLSLFYVVPERGEDDSIFKSDNKSLKIRHIKYDYIANTARGVDFSIAFLAWPLFLYLILDKIDLVGAIGTLTGMLLIPFMIWVARRVDKRGVELLRFGVLIRSFVYPLRALVVGVYSAIGVNFIADVGDVATGGSHMQHYYKHADALGRVRYTYLMEYSYPLGSLIAWTYIGVLSVFFEAEVSLKLAFLTGALVTPFVLLFNHTRISYIKRQI